jgi:hypothetical protein
MAIWQARLPLLRTFILDSSVSATLRSGALCGLEWRERRMNPAQRFAGDPRSRVGRSGIISLTNSMPLACIAHKSLEICERCRLKQQNSPAKPVNSTAILEKSVSTVCSHLIVSKRGS